MATSTLQQRQQEIHRPFQPFAETRGRAGGDIPEPQEQYAGGWNVGESITRGISNMFSSLGRGLSSKKEDKLDPEAANIFSKAAKDVLKTYNEMTPEELEKWELYSAQKGQTTSSLIQNIAKQKAFELAESKGIPAYKQVYAEENFFKVDSKGIEKMESVYEEMNKKIVASMVENGTAEKYPNGQVNYQATLAKAYENIEAVRKINTPFKEDLNSRGISWEQYLNAPEADKKGIENNIIIDKTLKYDTIYKNDIIPQLQGYLDGTLEAEGVLNWITTIVNNEKRNNERLYASDAPSIQQALDTYLDSFYNQAKSFLENKTADVTDKENQLKKIDTLLQIEGITGRNVASRMERDFNRYPKLTNYTMNVASKTGDMYLDIPSYSTYSEKEGYMLQGVDVGNPDENGYVGGVPKKNLQLKVNLFDNTFSISSGLSPTAGTVAEQKMAVGAVETYVATESEGKNYKEIDPEVKDEAKGLLSTIRDNTVSVLTNSRNANGRKGEFIFNMVDIGSNLEMLKHLSALDPTDPLRTSYWSMSDAVTDGAVNASKIIPTLQKVALKKDEKTGEYSTVNYNKQIFFDRKSNKFVPRIGYNEAEAIYESDTERAAIIGAQLGGEVAGVHGAVLGGLWGYAGSSQINSEDIAGVDLIKAIEELNKIYTYDYNMMTLKKNDKLTEQEAEGIARNLIGKVIKGGVNKSIFPNYRGLNKEMIQFIPPTEEELNKQIQETIKKRKPLTA